MPSVRFIALVLGALLCYLLLTHPEIIEVFLP